MTELATLAPAKEPNWLAKLLPANRVVLILHAIITTTALGITVVAGIQGSLPITWQASTAYIVGLLGTIGGATAAVLKFLNGSQKSEALAHETYRQELRYRLSAPPASVSNVFTNASTTTSTHADEIEQMDPSIYHADPEDTSDESNLGPEPEDLTTPDDDSENQEQWRARRYGQSPTEEVITPDSASPPPPLGPGSVPGATTPGIRSVPPPDTPPTADEPGGSS